MFKTKRTDKLNQAHTLGLGAITMFEELADDLEVAGNLAAVHASETEDTMAQLRQERDSADAAAIKYASAAERIRGLVSA